MSAPASGIAAYVFDLYGTLVDYATLRDRFVGLARDPDAFVAAWRQKQLAYALAASLMRRYEDFDTLTRYAYDYVASALGVADAAAQRAAAVAAWSALPPFPDAAETVRALRSRGVATAVLSNGTPRALAATLAGAGLTDAFDAVLSVDAARAYKPDPAAYALATACFATTPDRIVFVSSNGWDATGGAAFGFRVAWCNRAGLPAETLGAPPERTIATLRDLLA